MTKSRYTVKKSLFNKFDYESTIFDDNGPEFPRKRQTSSQIQRSATAVGLLVIVVTFGIIFFPTKFNISKSYTALSDDIIVKIGASSEWVQENYDFFMWPVTFASATSLLGALIVYFDSDVPGQYPPSPFSPQKHHSYRLQQDKSSFLSYLVAIGSGIVTFILIVRSS